MSENREQDVIRDAVRDFAQTELWPHAARWDKEHHFPKEAHQGLAALGAYGICVPEELGGAHLDYVTLALVLEEIAAGDGGTSTAISVTNCPVNAISGERRQPHLIDPSICIRCGICKQVCNFNAILVE